MIKWLGRHRGTLIFGLSLLALALFVANIGKHNLLSASWLAQNKDAISALNNVVGMLVLILGSVFSYFRFFRGRTLALRAELSLSVSVHATTEGFLIHAVSLNAKNVGNVTIWNPVPRIVIEVDGPPEVKKTESVIHWSEELVSAPKSIPVIEPGETVTFFAIRHVVSSAWAVMYTGTLQADQGDSWHISRMISNAKTGKDA